MDAVTDDMARAALRELKRRKWPVKHLYPATGNVDDIRAAIEAALKERNRAAL